MQNGIDYVEGLLKPIISEHIDVLTSKTQMIALDRGINNKLTELRNASDDLKLSATTKVNNLIEQASIKNQIHKIQIMKNKLRFLLIVCVI
jgi:hypothetical protein